MHYYYHPVYDLPGVPNAFFLNKNIDDKIIISILVCMFLFQ